LAFTGNHNENELFRLLAGGDEKAYTQIFHLFTPRLFPYILKITKNEHLARELLQETFVRLWVKRIDLHQVSYPASWLFRIAANICLSYLRTQATRNQLQDKVLKSMPPSSYPVNERVETKDFELLIAKAVESLPPKRKEIYLLSRENGLSHQQIADQVGLSINTVKNHISLALRSIQEHLNKETGLSLVTLWIILSL
jgi:RNA polymerase sigma-70 factor (family 1)